MNSRTLHLFVCAAALGLTLPHSACAHQLDEYLQATRISVDHNRVDLEINLTAGVAVAERVFASIDTNRDGEISSAEAEAYAQLALDSMSLEVDDSSRPLTLSSFRFPSFSDMSLGVGTIRLQATAAIPAAPGLHHLVFMNTHEAGIGAYLVNALVPADRQIKITGQDRDTRQHEFKMSFRVVEPEQSWPPTPGWWLIAGICLAAISYLGLKTMPISRLAKFGVLFAAVMFCAHIEPAQAQTLPNSIDDREFWRMITDMSEPPGSFQLQYMSNEDSAQFVIPALKETIRPGGVYIGVGLEQNFTYVAVLEPKLAFIVDIRRDNMLEHLMYKALFELSADRADFLSRLLSRKRPRGLDANTSVKALFDAYQTIEADSTSYDDNLLAVVDHLVKKHKLPLSETDKSDIARILRAFRTAGPYTLRGQGDATNPTYAQLMTAADLTGRNQSYLASEQNFKIVQKLEQQNLIVPLVGDFAGSKTLVGIGKYLKERNAIVNVFYLSNVERYLFQQGDDARKFYANVEALPLNPTSVFIRSVTSDISRRLGIPISENAAKWRSYVAPIGENLKSFNSGKIRAYPDLF